MIYDRYYFSLLSLSEKKAYKAIYHGLEAYQEAIPINKSLCSSERIQRILSFIGFDNPHIFYVDFSSVEYEESFFGFRVIPTYFYIPAEIETLKREVDATLRRILGRVTGKTEYEKEMSVHDLLVSHVVYDKTAADNIQNYSYRSNSILGVLFYKSAVCEGIAKITKYLLNALDIKCIVAYGTTPLDGDANHAWNIVKINGEAYHLDVTWDIDGCYRGIVSHNYFNLSDSDICADHSWSQPYPACRSEQMNYFCYNRLTVDSEADVQAMIRNAITRGNSCLAFRYIAACHDFDELVRRAADYANGLSGRDIRFSKKRTLQTCTMILC